MNDLFNNMKYLAQNYPLPFAVGTALILPLYRKYPRATVAAGLGLIAIGMLGADSDSAKSDSHALHVMNESESLAKQWVTHWYIATVWTASPRSFSDRTDPDTYFQQMSACLKEKSGHSFEFLDCDFKILNDYLGNVSIHNFIKKWMGWQNIQNFNHGNQTIGELAHIYGERISNVVEGATFNMTALCQTGMSKMCSFQQLLSELIANGLSSTSVDAMRRKTLGFLDDLPIQSSASTDIPSPMTDLLNEMNLHCANGAEYACNYLMRIQRCFTTSRVHRDWAIYASCHASAALLKTVEFLGGSVADVL